MAEPLSPVARAGLEPDQRGKVNPLSRRDALKTAVGFAAGVVSLPFSSDARPSSSSDIGLEVLITGIQELGIIPDSFSGFVGEKGNNGEDTGRYTFSIKSPQIDRLLPNHSKGDKYAELVFSHLAPKDAINTASILGVSDENISRWLPLLGLGIGAVAGGNLLSRLATGRITRRDFLKLAAITGGGAALLATFGGGVAIGTANAERIREAWNDLSEDVRSLFRGLFGVAAGSSPPNDNPVRVIPTDTHRPSSSPSATATKEPPTPTLTITSSATPRQTETQRPPTFHEILDQKGITLGVFIDPRYNDPSRDGKIILENFNLLHPGAFSWDWIRRDGPEIEKTDFALADRWISFAQKNGMSVRGGSLVTNEGLPDWLIKGNYSKDQLIEKLQEHIKRVVGRYKGRVSEWMVTNEVFIYWNGQKKIQDSIWYRTIGSDFIDIAFQAAREADPDAKLIYNDFDIEVEGPKADYIFDQVKRLKEKGLVDAVGFQMHITKPPNLDAANPPTKDQLIAQMRRYSDIDVEVILTELDVDASRLPGNEAQQLAKQAEIYRMVIEACLEAGIKLNATVWGLNDDESYLEKQGNPDANPLLFSFGKPKPAFDAIRDTILILK